MAAARYETRPGGIVSSESTGITIGELLKQEAGHLLQLRHWAIGIRAFRDELARVTKGKPFWAQRDRVDGDALSRDLLVIQAASWCTAAVSPRGLFGMLQASELKKLYARKVKNPPPIDDHEAYAEYKRREALERVLSEAAARGCVNHADIEALKNQCQARFGPVKAAANSEPRIPTLSVRSCTPS